MTSSTEISLIDMPEVVMKNILDKSDFHAIQSLRKVCSSLRNFIDDSKPDPRISVLRIWVAREEISVTYDELSIEYQKHEGGCLVIRKKEKRRKTEKLLETEDDFWKLAIRDLDVNLKNHKSIIDEFEILNGELNDDYFRESVLEPFLKILGDTLKCKPRPLSVKQLEMDPLDQEEVLAILPYIDPNSLESIRIEYTFYEEIDKPEDVIEINILAKLDQWKNIKRLNARLYMSLDNFKEHFGHIETVDISVNYLTREDLVEMKRTILESEMMTHLEIWYVYFNEDPPFGEASIVKNEQFYFWYFNVQTYPNRVLKIVQDKKFPDFTFEIINREMVPINVIVEV